MEIFIRKDGLPITQGSILKSEAKHTIAARVKQTVKGRKKSTLTVDVSTA